MIGGSLNIELLRARQFLNTFGKISQWGGGTFRDLHYEKGRARCVAVRDAGHPRARLVVGGLPQRRGPPERSVVTFKNSPVTVEVLSRIGLVEQHLHVGGESFLVHDGVLKKQCLREEWQVPFGAGEPQQATVPQGCRRSSGEA